LRGNINNFMNSEVKRNNKRLWFIFCGFWLVVSNLHNYPAQAKNITINAPLSVKKAAKDQKISLCSNQSLETLTTQFLQDLPSYANRASQRARRLSRATEVFSYMVVAGRPEFEPLPLNPGDYTRDTLTTVSEGVEQVFFTTLERQYIAGKAIELQLFHWLFLTKTESGWQFVMMLSQIGSYPKNQPPTPPQDSSNGVVAQGIKAWLRDCRAGSLRSTDYRRRISSYLARTACISCHINHLGLPTSREGLRSK
jgi:hypothetical protein